MLHQETVAGGTVGLPVNLELRAFRWQAEVGMLAGFNKILACVTLSTARYAFETCINLDY